MESNRQAPDPDSSSSDPAARIEQALAALRRRSGRGPGGGPGGGQSRRGGGPFPLGTFPGGPFGTGAFGRNPFGWDPRGRGGTPESGQEAASDIPNRDRHPGHGGPHWGHGDAGPGGFARFRALEALADGPRTVTELAELIGVDQPRASRLVAFGVKAGVLRKAQDPADARRAIVELTDAGREAIAAARARRRGSLDRGLASFTPEEAEQFATYLERFVAGWSAAD